MNQTEEKIFALLGKTTFEAHLLMDKVRELDAEITRLKGELNKKEE